MGKLESFNAVSSLILGQSETLLPIKISSAKSPAIACTPCCHGDVHRVDVHRWCIHDHAEPKYVVAALVLNMFSTFIVLR